METILNIGYISIIVQLSIELVKVIVGLEKHTYIDSSYDHSIQHFAYLAFYLIGFTLVVFKMYEWGALYILLGTLVLNYHIRLERLGRV